MQNIVTSKLAEHSEEAQAKALNKVDSEDMLQGIWEYSSISYARRNGRQSDEVMPPPVATV